MTLLLSKVTAFCIFSGLGAGGGAADALADAVCVAVAEADADAWFDWVSSSQPLTATSKTSQRQCFPMQRDCIISGVNRWNETVVLLHGLGRTRASLLFLQLYLQRAGFATKNFPYRTSGGTTLDDITRELHRYIEDEVDTPRYHLVGHSLGNIIIRNGFRAPYPQGLSRIVMIAPPNRPARLAKELRDNPLFKLLSGDAGQKLGDDAFYRELPVPTCEFGIIAGSKGQSVTFDEPNDGVVALERTKLVHMNDWVEVDNIHTFIMNSRTTREHVVTFLREGKFRKFSKNRE